MGAQLLKYRQLAAETGLTIQHLRDLARKRKIPVVKLSARCHRFRLADVEAGLAKLTVKAL